MMVAESAESIIRERRRNPEMGTGRRARPGSHGESGFTLLEMLTVVIMISIVLAVGFPSYVEFYRSSSLVAIQTAVASKLREAPVLARALRKPVRAVVDLDNEQVWLEVDGAQFGSKVPSDPGRAEIEAIADATAPMTTGLAKFRFDYWGTVTEENASVNSYTIHFGNQGGSYTSADPDYNFRTITMVTATARVENYPVGCFGTNPWGTWQKCSDVNF